VGMKVHHSLGALMLFRPSSCVGRRGASRLGAGCWRVPTQMRWRREMLSPSEGRRLVLRAMAVSETGGMRSVSAMEALEEAEKGMALAYARSMIADEKVMVGLPEGAVRCAALRFGLAAEGPQSPKSEEETAALLGTSVAQVRQMTRLVSRRIPLVADRPEDGWPRLDVIFEDDHILVVAKPDNLRTAPVHRFMGHSLLARAIAYYGPPYDFVPRIVHRLDFGTSGVIVFGKTKEATFRLAHQIQHHWMLKEYLALCVDDTQEGGGGGQSAAVVGDRWAAALGISAAAGEGVGIRREAITVTDPNYSPTTAAFTEFTLVERGSPLNRGMPESVLLLCQPRSGRTHQIRIHSEAMGYPLIGEDLYGGRPELGLGPMPELGRQALHAWRLTFFHPVTCEQVSFEAPLPADIASVAKRVGMELDTLPPPQALPVPSDFASREWPVAPKETKREKVAHKRKNDILKRDMALGRKEQGTANAFRGQ